MQQLGDDQVRDLIVDRRAEEDDPLVEQTAVDVERALPARGLLDDHRYEWAHGPRFFRFLGRNPADCSNRPSARLGRVDRSRPFSARSSAARQLPGVQSCPDRRLGSVRASLPGVHSFSRALACSTLIGLASRDEQLDRLARGDVLAQPVEPPARAQLLEQLLDGRALRARRVGSSASRTSLVARLDPLGLDDRGEHGLAPERRRGLGLGLVGERLLVLAGDPQVGLLGDALARERRNVSSSSSCARAWTSLSGTSTSASATAASTTASSNSRSIALLVGLAQPLGDVLAQLVERVEAGRLGRRTRRRARAGAWP